MMGKFLFGFKPQSRAPSSCHYFIIYQKSVFASLDVASIHPSTRKAQLQISQSPTEEWNLYQKYFTSIFPPPRIFFCSLWESLKTRVMWLIMKNDSIINGSFHAKHLRNSRTKYTNSISLPFYLSGQFSTPVRISLSFSFPMITFFLERLLARLSRCHNEGELLVRL